MTIEERAQKFVRDYKDRNGRICIDSECEMDAYEFARNAYIAGATEQDEIYLERAESAFCLHCEIFRHRGCQKAYYFGDINPDECEALKEFKQELKGGVSK